MSCRKGNMGRTRAQKYQNTHAFKNNLHDTSIQTKRMNNLQIVNVCEKCKSVIEWKIKYKKYKPLKAASTCTKCQQKTVKHAYHTMCGPCAVKHEVCPKCNEKREIIKGETPEETVTLDRELRLLLKKLPERKRRTFLRYVNRKSQKKAKEEDSETDEDAGESADSEGDIPDDNAAPLTRDDLLEKLKSLMVSRDDGDNISNGCEGSADSSEEDSDED